MWKFKHVAVLFLCACTGATEEECTVTTHTPTCNRAIKYMSKQGKYIGQRCTTVTPLQQIDVYSYDRWISILIQGPHLVSLILHRHTTLPVDSYAMMSALSISYNPLPGVTMAFVRRHGLQLTLLVLPANAKPIEAGDLTRNFISSIPPRIFVRLLMY